MRRRVVGFVAAVGDQTVTPAAAAASWSAPASTIALGGISVQPSPSTAVWSTPAVTVVLGSSPQTVTPAPVTASWSVPAVTVLGPPVEAGLEVFTDGRYSDGAYSDAGDPFISGQAILSGIGSAALLANVNFVAGTNEISGVGSVVSTAAADYVDSAELSGIGSIETEAPLELSAPFQNLVSNPHQDSFVLVEMLVKERIAVWSLTVGLTNTYEATWNDVVRDDVYSGGLYRKVENMVENSTDLTRFDQLTDIEPNQGSWYFDVANDKIYVHTTDSTNPISKTVMFTKFRVYFGSRGKIYNDVYYEPRLSANSEIVVVEEQEDLLFGELKRVGTANIILNNGDGLFDTLAVAWTWKDSLVQIFFGGDEFAYNQLLPIGTFEIEDMDPGRQLAIIRTRDAQKITKQLVPSDQFETSTYPNMDSNKVGDAIPLLFGAKTNITPILIDDTAQKGKYLVADPNVESLFSLDAIYVDGVQLVTDDVIVDLVNCEFTIKSAFVGDTPAASSVTCDAAAPIVSNFSYETSTDYLKFYGELTGWLYSQVLGIVKPVDVDFVAAKSTDNDTPAPQAAYIQDRIPAGSIIRKLEKGVLGRTVITGDGAVKSTVFFPGSTEPLTEIPALSEADFAVFRPDTKIQSIFSEIHVTYDEDPTTGSKKIRKQSSDFTKFLQLNNRELTRTTDTYLKDQADADVLKQRVSFLSRSVDTEIEVEETSIRMIGRPLNGRVLITADRAPSASGRWDENVMEIRKLEKRLSPKPTVTARLSNMFGLGAFIGQWTADAANTWATSDATERSQNGFWTDNNGFVDPADPATKDVRLWW